MKFLLFLLFIQYVVAHDLLLYVVDQNQTVLSSATLNCDSCPPSGTHPNPVVACQDIQSIHADFSLLTPVPYIDCFRLYAPVTAYIIGKYQGKDVYWAKQYVNSCELSIASLHLFEFI
ncbi:subtilisin inhibitor [Pilobolus umbonatus]|nr:subtilisin inhibitor [Pilobolus umbonatus]